MSERALSDTEIEKMQTPVWQQVHAAIDAGDHEAAKALLDRAVAQWSSLQDYSINWIASLLTFIADELGEPAVERALRKTGDEFVRPRRSTDTAWGDLPAAQRAKVISRAMLANTGAVEVSEDDEKIILSFRCGSGGRLIDDGRYEGEHPYRTLTERSGPTFMRDEMWVYCAHCSVNNEIQPVEWGETPTSIEYPPTRPGEACVHHVYKDVTKVPVADYDRIGKAKP
ncbi:MAG: hypothetical protein JJE46_05275 [Acidimicrobiia bacterium]|nr:hypothetical protein [Acidimicrobiia bacterium]